MLGYEYRADSPDEDLIDPRGRPGHRRPAGQRPVRPGMVDLADAEGNEVDVATWMDHD